MRNSLLTCCMAMVISLAPLGCDEGGDDTLVEVSLGGDVLPIFQQQCSECHTRLDAPFPDAIVNGMYFETTDDIAAMIGSFVIAGDSANSGLVGVLRQDFGVGVTPTLMPPPDSGAPMSSENVSVIARWIDEGAKDN